MILVTCPRCPQRIKLNTGHWRGPEHTCPACEKPFTVYRGSDGRWATSLVNQKAVTR